MLRFQRLLLSCAVSICAWLILPTAGYAVDTPVCGQWVEITCQDGDHDIKVPALRVCGTEHHIVPDPLANGNWYPAPLGQYWRLTEIEIFSNSEGFQDFMCNNYSVEPGFIFSFWGETVKSCAACQSPTPTPMPTSTPTSLPTVAVPTVDPLPPTATPSLSLPAVPALGNTQLPGNALDRIVTIAPRINLRKGPGTNFEIVGNTRARETYFLNGKDATGRWWFACCHLGQEFWVANYINGVSAQGPLSDLPVVRLGETINKGAKQILFSAPGDKVEHVKISGKNQLGQDRVWEKTFSTPVAIVLTEGWWWQGSVQVIFKLQNSGWRGCIIEAIDHVAEHPNATITYSVASGCNGGNANTTLISRPESPNPLEVGGSLVLCVAGDVNDCIDTIVEIAIITARVAEEKDEKSEQTTSMIFDFETQGQWRRGDQTLGTLTYSKEQVHRGAYSARISYNFPVVADSFVVFSRSIPISKNPTQLKIWVFGDGSGNFLNAWLKDAYGRRWQFTFGRIYHSGWLQMTAVLNPNAGWPNGPLDGQSDAPQYPITFDALVLDGVDEAIPIESVIYLDDLIAE